MISECYIWINGAPKKESRMKKGMLVVVLVIATVTLAFPQAGHAGGHHYHYYGWYAPGAFVGGALLGAAIARPYYAYPPPAPVYVYPAPAYPPAYGYAAPSPVYAYPPQQGAYPGGPEPDPGSGYQGEGPPGEWVMVPGQYVNGTWVPEHQVQVPVN